MEFAAPDSPAAFRGTKNCDIPYHTQQTILHVLARRESSTVRSAELRISPYGTTRTQIFI
jgi:hypothetical protein